MSFREPPKQFAHPLQCRGRRGRAARLRFGGKSRWGSGRGARSCISRVSKPAPARGEPHGREGGASVNKTEFIERIAEEANGPKSEAQRYYEAVENVITSALKNGEEVQITGFGKFYVRNARPGRAETRRPERRCVSLPRRSPRSARVTCSRSRSRNFTPRWRSAGRHLPSTARRSSPVPADEGMGRSREKESRVRRIHTLHRRDIYTL